MRIGIDEAMARATTRDMLGLIGRKVRKSGHEGTIVALQPTPEGPVPIVRTRGGDSIGHVSELTFTDKDA